MCRDCEDDKMQNHELTKSMAPTPLSLLTVKGIAVKPPPKVAPKTKEVGGIIVAEYKTGLVEFEVVAEGVLPLTSSSLTYLQAGEFIYVTSQALASFGWAKEVYELDGMSFIVVPPEFVVAVKR